VDFVISSASDAESRRFSVLRALVAKKLHFFIDVCNTAVVAAGNPFVFMVIDPLKVAVRGDGLGLIKANQSTSFVISAPAADIPDLDVVITGTIRYVMSRYQFIYLSIKLIQVGGL